MRTGSVPWEGSGRGLRATRVPRGTGREVVGHRGAQGATREGFETVGVPKEDGNSGKFSVAYMLGALSECV